MSSKDLDRLEVLRAIQEKSIKQTVGAQKLNITTRQMRNLMKRWLDEGSKGIVSRRVGAPSNNRLSQGAINQIFEFFKDLNHNDFGPTLAHEYLAEQDKKISISSVRSVMIRNDLWHPKAIRMLNVHPLRARRERKGELIQLDGLEHDWFEGHGPRCTLLVFIDDATSETMHLKFVKSENTFDYMEATREYIEKHGRPEAFYPDKHIPHAVRFCEFGVCETKQNRSELRSRFE